MSLSMLTALGSMSGALVNEGIVQVKYKIYLLLLIGNGSSDMYDINCDVGWPISGYCASSATLEN